MYKRILVPVDMAEHSFVTQVVKEAQAILASDGKLLLLTAVPGYQMPLVGSFFPQGSFDRMVDDIYQQLEKYASKELKLNPDQFELFVKEGSPSQVILDTAQDENADIIVMASHKQSNVERVVVGNITSKVVGRSDRPVMVVKSKH